MKHRERLASPLLSGGILLGVGISLALLFPVGTRVHAEHAKARKPGAIPSFTQPDGASALATRMAPADPMESLMQRLWSEGGALARHVLVGELRQRMQALLDSSASVDVLERAANWALEAGLTDVAPKLFLSAAKVGEASRARLLESAGRWYLAAGNQLDAVECFDQASQFAAGERARRRLQRRALDAAVAAAEGARIRALVRQYAEGIASEPDFGRELAKAASASGDAILAAEVGRLVMDHWKADPAASREQAERELASGSPPRALALLAPHADRKDAEVSLLERAATVAIWAGDLDRAAKYLSRAARARRSAPLAKHALSLLVARSDQKMALAMRELLVEIDDAERWEPEVVANLESLGRLSDAIAFSRRRWEEHAPQDARRAARLVELSARVDGASGAFELCAKLPALQKLVARSCARAAEGAGKPDSVLAWAIGDDDEAHMMRANAAWMLGRVELARDALVVLEQRSKLTHLLAERLVLSWVHGGKPLRAMESARRAFRTTGDARFGLWSAQIALDQGQHRVAEEILEQLVVGGTRSPAVAALHADVLLAMGQGQRAAEVLRAARRAFPADRDLVRAELWALVEIQATDEAYAVVRSLQAEPTPREWLAPIALILDRAGRVRESIPYYAQFAAHHPTDVLFGLSYADALRRAGFAESSEKVRLHVARTLRSLERTRGLDASVRARALSLLAERTHGDEARVATLERHAHTEGAQELLVAIHLSGERFELARAILLRMGAAAQRRMSHARLALAEHDKSAPKLRALAEDPVASDETRVDALLATRQDGRALALIQKSIERMDTIDEEKVARALELEREAVPRASASVGQEQLSAATSILSRASVRLSWGRMRLLPAMSVDWIRGDNWSSVRSEASARVTYEAPGIKMGALAGARHRDGRTDPTLDGSVSLTSGGGARVELEGRYGAIPTDSVPLRLVGLRDEVRLGAGIALPYSFSIDGSASLFRETSLGRDPIAVGYATSLRAGMASPVDLWGMRVRSHVSASYTERFQLSPLALDRALLPLGLSGAVAARASALSWGAGISRGIVFDPLGGGPSPRFDLDFELGYLVTSDRVGMSGRGAFGSRLIGRDDVSVGGYFSTAVGGVVEDVLRGFDVRYTRAW